MDRTQYYRDYYYRKKDQVKYRYYEKKEQREQCDKLYEPYGGERAYYTMKIKEFCNITIIPKSSDNISKIN